jgi:hypothetical protein
MNSIQFLNRTTEPKALILFSDRLGRKLSPLGASKLLCVAIRTAPQEAACTLMNGALRDLSAGQPLPPFMGYADEALFWTSLAPLAERKVYLAAIWQTLPTYEQSAFLNFVQRGVAA